MSIHYFQCPCKNFHSIQLPNFSAYKFHIMTCRGLLNQTYYFCGHCFEGFNAEDLRKNHVDSICNYKYIKYCSFNQNNSILFNSGAKAIIDSQLPKNLDLQQQSQTINNENIQQSNQQQIDIGNNIYNEQKQQKQMVMIDLEDENNDEEKINNNLIPYPQVKQNKQESNNNLFSFRFQGKETIYSINNKQIFEKGQAFSQFLKINSQLNLTLIDKNQLNLDSNRINQQSIQNNFACSYYLEKQIESLNTDNVAITFITFPIKAFIVMCSFLNNFIPQIVQGDVGIWILGAQDISKKFVKDSQQLIQNNGVTKQNNKVNNILIKLEENFSNNSKLNKIDEVDENQKSNIMNNFTIEELNQLNNLQQAIDQKIKEKEALDQVFQKLDLEKKQNDFLQIEVQKQKDSKIDYENLFTQMKNNFLIQREQISQIEIKAQNLLRDSIQAQEQNLQDIFENAKKVMQIQLQQKRQEEQEKQQEIIKLKKDMEFKYQHLYEQQKMIFEQQNKQQKLKKELLDAQRQKEKLKKTLFSQRQEGFEKCLYCLENKHISDANVLVLPCRHLVLCQFCLNESNITHCPQCKEKILQKKLVQFECFENNNILL